MVYNEIKKSKNWLKGEDIVKKSTAIFGGVILFVMALLLTACGSGSPAGGGTSGSAPIKIGHIVHATGSAVEAGSNEKNGALLAVAEINAKGGVNGRQLTIVQEDGQSSNTGVVQAFQKLLEDKDIVVVIGPTPSTQVAAMMPTVNDAKIPVSIGGTNYGLTHSGSKWLFRFRPHDGFSAKAMANFAVQDLKHSKVAVVHSTDAFGSGGRDLVVGAMKELGITPVLDQGYNNDEKDYTAVINALKQSGATVMVTYMTMSPDVGIFAKQIKQQGLQIDWVGSSSNTATAGRDLAESALYGTYAVADFHPNANEKAKAFAAAYKAKYGKDADFYSACTYDAVYVYAEAMKKAKDLKPDSIREALLSIKGFQGAEGEYNFDQNGDGLDSYSIVRNDNNVINVVKTLKFQR